MTTSIFTTAPTREYNRREQMLFDAVAHWNREAKRAADGWARTRAERNAAGVSQKLSEMIKVNDDLHEVTHRIGAAAADDGVTFHEALTIARGWVPSMDETTVRECMTVAALAPDMHSVGATVYRPFGAALAQAVGELATEAARFVK